MLRPGYATALKGQSAATHCRTAICRHPLPNRIEESVFHAALKMALPDPQKDFSIVAGFAGGQEVDASENHRFIRRDHGVSEGSPNLELLLVPP